MSAQAEAVRAGTARHSALGLSDADALRMYRLMVTARRFSERTLTLAFQGRIVLAVPADGHEAAQVGAVLPLGRDDVLYPFYRGVGSALARGQTVRELMLDHFARAESPNGGGKQMPCHWVSRELNLIPNSSSVGTHIPHAVGSALAARLRRRDSVAMATFGEGAVSKGDFHEGLNFAAIHRLPVILVCENNRYAISVPFRLESPVPSVADRAAAYGVTGVSVDGMDPLEVFAAVRDARRRALSGDGPTVVEARVYRFSLHTSHVGVENYRDRGEVDRERAHDPLLVFERYLGAVGLLQPETTQAIERDVKAEIDSAIEYAEAAPYPAAEEATLNVLAS